MEQKQKTKLKAFQLVHFFIFSVTYVWLVKKGDCFAFFVKKKFCVAKPRNHFPFCEVRSDNLSYDKTIEFVFKNLNTQLDRDSGLK